MDFIFLFDYLFIYFNQVSFDQPRETNIDVVCATWYIFVAMQTVLHVEWIIFIGENLHVPSPCIWVNLTLTLLTRWKLIILSNSDPWKLWRVCNFKKILWQVINFQLHQLIINNGFGRLLEPWTHTYLNIFKLIFFLPKSNLN